MLRTILTPPTHMRLQHIAPIQKRHFPILFYPDLIPRMRRNDIQRRNVQTEFPRFCKFAKTGPQRE